MTDSSYAYCRESTELEEDPTLGVQNTWRGPGRARRMVKAGGNQRKCVHIGCEVGESKLRRKFYARIP